MNISIEKLGDNFPYCVNGEIHEQGICSGFGFPLKEDELINVDNIINGQVKSNSEHHDVKIIVKIISDCRIQQTKLF